MKVAMRLLLILGLLAVVQSGNAFADTVRDFGGTVVSYSGSFVFDSTSSFTSLDRVLVNRDHSRLIEVVVDMPIAVSEYSSNVLRAEAVVAIPVEVEIGDTIDLLRPERSSGERTAEAPIEIQAAAVPEPISVILLGMGLLPLLRRKQNR